MCCTTCGLAKGSGQISTTAEGVPATIDLSSMFAKPEKCGLPLSHLPAGIPGFVADGISFKPTPPSPVTAAALESGTVQLHVGAATGSSNSSVSPGSTRPPSLDGAANFLPEAARPGLPFHKGGRHKHRARLTASGSSTGTYPTTPVDGGTGGDPGVGPSRSLASSAIATPHPDGLLFSQQITSRQSSSGFSQRDSQASYCSPDQTVIVFDWDDTLFPTNYVHEELGCAWDASDDQAMSDRLRDVARDKLITCERSAAAVLQVACSLAQVVVITLASPGWVETACTHFYPQVGHVMRRLDVKVVYAQEQLANVEPLPKHAGAEEQEIFWGLVKGRAISDAVESFYSQYEGQSWKNILSIGDAPFERYGLLAAGSAYMQGSQIGSRESSVWHPTQEGCWQKAGKDGRLLKLRAKCCKFVDLPDVEELAIELEILMHWLDSMVRLDSGFDLDMAILADPAQVTAVEDVLAGRVPPSALARPGSLQSFPSGIGIGAGSCDGATGGFDGFSAAGQNGADDHEVQSASVPTVAVCCPTLGASSGIVTMAGCSSSDDSGRADGSAAGLHAGGDGSDCHVPRAEAVL